MKRMKFFTAIIMAAILTFSLTGCGTVNASGIVKSNLDLLTTGEVTDEMLENVDLTEEEMMELYNEDYDELVQTIVDSLDAEAYVNDGGKEQIDAFMKAYTRACKYEVSEEAVQNDDDSYTVTVTAYPMDITTRMTEYVEGEFTTEWTEKISSGEYSYTTDDQLMIDMYSGLFSKLTEMLDDVSYGDAVELEVKVEPADDNTYTPNEDDLGNVLTTCMGMEEDE